MASDSWSFTTTSTVTDATIWPSSALPNVASSGDPAPQELGVKFRSDIAGYITGVRFYKGAGNTGTHVGHLWTASGTLLATATFTSETATGWQQVNFSQPVRSMPIPPTSPPTLPPTAATPSTARTSPRQASIRACLHALSNTAAGGNGVFPGRLVGFPEQLLQFGQLLGRCRLQQHDRARHRRQDAGSQCHGSERRFHRDRHVHPGDEPDDGEQFELPLRAVGASSDVPATVSYSGLTATITPTQPLALNTTYQVTVSGSMTASDGTPLGSDTTWSFTTQPHLTFTDTTVADFTAGTPDANVVFVETGNGEAILKPIAGTEFSGTSLPSDWTGTPWSGGGGLLSPADG